MATQFETVEWAATANVYEVNLRQYTAEGTLAAFEKALPRLRNMGVDILWFMPLTPVSVDKRQGSLGSYYAVADYRAVNSEFGTMEDLKKVVRSAHALGCKVIIDWVANHTGYDHVWTREHPNYYKKNDQGNFYEQYGWVDVIDLDYGNKDLWNAMIEVMTFWVSECDIDGFRCDMAHLVPLAFWKEARTKLEQQKKMFWLAECEVPAYHEVFDATYGWELLHKMEAVYKSQANPYDLQEVLFKYQRDFAADALRLLFTSNHDENSHSGSEYERFGNGAKAFAVLCALWKNSLPLVYSGQELPNKKRLKFFDKDQIEWTGDYFIAGFYQTLLSLRKTCPALLPQREVKMLETDAPGKIFGFVRKFGQSAVLVLLNLSSASQLKFTITSDFDAGLYTSVFSGLELTIDRQHTFQIEEWEYLVYYKA